VLKSRQALPDPETLLLDYAERLTHHRAGRRALFVGLSGLAPTPHADGHWRVVDNLIAPLVQRRGGEIFRLRNGDVVAVLASADRALAERVTLKLRYFFRDDPLVAREDKTGAALLCRWFELGSEYDAFLALARRIKTRLDEPALPAAAVPEETAAPEEGRGPRDPRQAPLIRWLGASLSGPRALERLAGASLAARLRPNETPQLMFELLTPRMEAVLDTGLPEADLERNPRLAGACAQLAARRLLIEIPGARRPEEPLAIRLGLDILLGTEFLALHRCWALGRWTPLTLIVSHAECHADPARLRYVRGMLRKLGHRLGIGDAPIEVLSERGRLDADLVTFAWRPAFGRGEEHAFDAVRRAFAERSPEDVMLTGADTRDALTFARTLGITLIAGRQAAIKLGRG
jgi:hypothetical protein